MRKVFTALVLAIAVPVAIVFGAGASGDGGGDYKVRAIFDNASFLIPGEDVKVAGAKVGTVDSTDVTADHKAAIVLKIEREGFKDFRSDARCSIRLQSVIGEKLVDCTPTQPRGPGDPAPPELQKIPEGEPGAGQRLLPVENTVTPVDADLINSIQRRPFRERLSILLNEFGIGLAARGSDIREVIQRANPAFKEFDQFLKILADQNTMLRDLAEDSDRVLTALANKRENVADFFVQSGEAAAASAEKKADLERNFAKFPAFLRQLRPFMERYAQLSDEMAPVISDLRDAGPDISRFLVALGPFSRATIPALNTLGDTADIGREALKTAYPLANRINEFSAQALGVTRNLSDLLTSIEDHKGIERLVSLLYNLTLSTNGFDEIGHYLRNNLIVTICSGYSITPTVGCSANFQSASSSSATASGRKGNPALATSAGSPTAVARALIDLIAGSNARRDDNGSKSEKKAEKRAAVEEPGGSGEAPNGGEATGGQPEPNTQGEAPAAPLAETPSQPAPVRPPSVQNDSTEGKEALLDYLLGASK
jgi:phospholipid/cholesterol/gamma-HCH transport system substrate-binding protein